MNLIEKLGIEKCRGIVDGAPDSTATHYIFNKIPHYYSVDFQSWFYDGEWWDSDCYTETDLIDSYGFDFVISLLALKQAIEKYDSEHAEMIDYSQAAREVEK